MNKKNIGLFFVLVSLVLSSFNLLFTGAVVGAGSVSLSLVAVVFFIAGVVLIFIGATLEALVVAENIASPSEVMSRIRDVANGEDVAVVTDTSFWGAYSKEGVNILLDDLQKNYGGAVVSDYVLGELRGVTKDLREPVLRGSVMLVEGYEKYREQARNCLEKSRKAFYYNDVIPIILGKKEAPKSRNEAAPYVAAVKKLISHVKSNYMEMSKKNLVVVADKHCRVSDVDVDVFAAALAEVNSGRKAIVAERDVNFEDALEGLREVDPKLGSRIYCVNCYKKVA